MNANEYQKLAMRTNSHKDKEKQLTNAALGLAGEVGEVSDIIKKALFHGHELKANQIKDELGDVLWYIALLCDSCDLTLDEVMQYNIGKLKDRYPDGFNEEASRNRER